MSNIIAFIFLALAFVFCSFLAISGIFVGIYATIVFGIAFSFPIFLIESK